MAFLFPVALVIGVFVVVGLVRSLASTPRSRRAQWVCTMLSRAAARLDATQPVPAGPAGGTGAETTWTADLTPALTPALTTDATAARAAEPDPNTVPMSGPVRATAGLERDLMTLPAIRRRLDALTAELSRLERDRTVFARAFHTMVAQSAYAALVADQSRLSATAFAPQPVPAGAPRLGPDLVRGSTSGYGATWRREELEL